MTLTSHEELEKYPEPLPAAPGDQAYLRLWFALARLPWRSLILVPGHPEGSASKAALRLAEVGQKVSGLPVRAITLSSLDYGTALALADLQEQIRRLAQELDQAPHAIEVYPGENHPEGEVPAQEVPTERGAREGASGREGQEGEGPGAGAPAGLPRQDGAQGSAATGEETEEEEAAPAGPPEDGSGEDAQGAPNWIPGDRGPGFHGDPNWTAGRPGGDHPPTASMLRPSAARFVIGIPCLISEPLGLSATQGADAVVILVERGRTSMAGVRHIIELVGRERVAGCIMVE